MPSKKHYIITSLTLGIIAATSAALIGVTNLVTRDQIKKNEENKIKAGICKIFGKTASISFKYDCDQCYNEPIKVDNYSINLDGLYSVNSDEVKELKVIESLAFQLTGSNMHGKLSLLIGFDVYDCNGSVGFVGVSTIINEQTYASTLEENYIDPVNNGNRTIDDVSCGATYGAKLAKIMIEQAQAMAGCNCCGECE